jgi:anti-sigma-K factor RskA
MDQPADIHTLSGAYAVDAVDDLERAAFERHLELCPDCREEVRSLRETLVRLADGTAVTPPQGLKQQVMRQIHTTSPARGHPAATPALPRPRSPRAPWLVAAVFALLAAGAGTVAWDQHRAADSAGQLAAVAADPDATRTVARATGGGAVSLVVAGQRAALVTSAMPALPAGHTYQLWVVRATHAASAGLGPAEAAAAGSWSRLVDGVRPGDVVAVTVEPAGGSAQPTTTPIVTLTA